MAGTVKTVYYRGNDHYYTLNIDEKSILMKDLNGEGRLDNLKSIPKKYRDEAQALVTTFRNELDGEVKRAHDRFITSDPSPFYFVPDYVVGRMWDWDKGNLGLSDNDQDKNADYVRFDTKTGAIVRIEAEWERKCIKRDKLHCFFSNRRSVKVVSILEAGKKDQVYYVSTSDFNKAPRPVLKENPKESEDPVFCPDEPQVVDVSHHDPMRRGVERYLSVFDDIVRIEVDYINPMRQRVARFLGIEH